jgi:hypothetical protein
MASSVVQAGSPLDDYFNGAFPIVVVSALEGQLEE